MPSRTRSTRTRSRRCAPTSAGTSPAILGYVYFITFTNLSGNTVDVLLDRVRGKGRAITVYEGVVGALLAPILFLHLLLVKLRRARRNRQAAAEAARRPPGCAAGWRKREQGRRVKGQNSRRNPMPVPKIKAKHDKLMNTKLPPEEVAKLIKKGAFLVDVRSKLEAKKGIAPGATKHPARDAQASPGDLPRDRNIVLYCGTGGRAGKAQEDAGGQRIQGDQRRRLQGCPESTRGDG